MAGTELEPWLKRSLYSTMKALEMGETPLLIAEESKRWQFVSTVPDMVGGNVVYGSAQDSYEQTLASISQSDLLLLILEEKIDVRLGAVLRYYLTSRDQYGADDLQLKRKFATHPIRPKHRLIIVASKAAAGELGHGLLKLATVISVQ